MEDDVDNGKTVIRAFFYSAPNTPCSHFRNAFGPAPTFAPATTADAVGRARPRRPFSRSRSSLSARLVRAIPRPAGGVAPSASAA